MQTGGALALKNSATATLTSCSLQGNFASNVSLLPYCARMTSHSEGRAKKMFCTTPPSLPCLPSQSHLCFFCFRLNPVLACILLCMLSSGGPVLSSLKCSFCTGRRTGSARLGTSNNHALLIYRQQRLSGERVWLCIKHATQSGLGFAVQTWGELLS